MPSFVPPTVDPSSIIPLSAFFKDPDRTGAADTHALGMTAAQVAMVDIIIPLNEGIKGTGFCKGFSPDKPGPICLRVRVGVIHAEHSFALNTSHLYFIITELLSDIFLCLDRIISPQLSGISYLHRLIMDPQIDRPAAPAGDKKRINPACLQLGAQFTSHIGITQISRLRRPCADAHTGAETGDAAHEARAQNDGASRVKGIAGFFQPGEKEPHIKTSPPHVVTQRRTGDGVKVYPTRVKINFSQFAGENFILSQSATTSRNRGMRLAPGREREHFAGGR